MPKKLTLAQVAKLARAKDAAAWDSLSLEKQQEMVDRLNGVPDEKAQHRANLAKFDRNMDRLLGRGAKRR